jgi:hypothetical protein
MKITEAGRILGYVRFSRGKSYVLISTKNGLHFGRFW